MNNIKDTAPFDPGFSDFVMPFSDTAEAVKMELTKLKPMHQKKFKFKTLEPVIFKSLETTLGFYSGCMLWAYYIKNKFINNPKEISGNTFLELKKEDLEKYDFLYEVEYLSNYFSQYEKDCKYYLSKNVTLDTKYMYIANNYKEFLILNNNFVDTKKTSDIKLPEQLIESKVFTTENLDEIYDLIQKSIKEGDLTLILDKV